MSTQKDCQSKPERAKVSYRPSWFVWLAFGIVLVSVIRIMVGAPMDVLLIPSFALGATIWLDLLSRRDR